MRHAIIIILLSSIAGCNSLGITKEWLVERSTNRVVLEYESYRTWSEREVLHLDITQSDVLYSVDGIHKYQALPIVLKLDSETDGIIDYWDYENDLQNSLQIFPFYSLARGLSGEVKVSDVIACGYNEDKGSPELPYINKCDFDWVEENAQDFTIIIDPAAPLEKGRSYVLRFKTGKAGDDPVYIDYPFTVVRQNEVGTFVAGSLFTTVVALLTARFP